MYIAYYFTMNGYYVVEFRRAEMPRVRSLTVSTLYFEKKKMKKL